MLYAELNLAVPPFDDPHVRRAVAIAIDRDVVAKVVAAGGPATPAYHMALDSQEEDLLVNYVPSWLSASSSDAARLAAARAEMRKSRYDRNGDGRCDAPSCSGDLAYVPASPSTPSGARRLDSLPTSSVRSGCGSIRKSWAPFLQAGISRPLSSGTSRSG